MCDRCIGNCPGCETEAREKPAIPTKRDAQRDELIECLNRAITALTDLTQCECFSLNTVGAHGDDCLSDYALIERLKAVRDVVPVRVVSEPLVRSSNLPAEAWKAATVESVPVPLHVEAYGLYEVVYSFSYGIQSAVELRRYPNQLFSLAEAWEECARRRAAEDSLTRAEPSWRGSWPIVWHVRQVPVDGWAGLQDFVGTGEG